MKKKKHRFLGVATVVVLAVLEVLTAFHSITVSAAGTVNGCTDGTPVNNLSASDYDMISDVDLLVGHGHPLSENAESLEKVVANADAAYFLGIASQFAVFLNGDMEVTAADSEGRTAVAGNMISTAVGGDGKYYNYQAGDGDYGSKIALADLDEYNGITKFAHVIVGGTTMGRINVKDWCSERKDWKEIAVSDQFSLSESYHTVNGSDVPYRSECNHAGGDELAHIWQSDAFGQSFFRQQFETITSRSEAVAKRTATGTVTVSGSSVTLDAGSDCTDKVIYFQLDSFDIIQNASDLYFTNIPDDSYMIISCEQEGTLNFGSFGMTKRTYINGEKISNNESSNWDEANKSNNNPNCSRILYNLPNADQISISCNFSGTILAPNADVKSDETCRGHLSGALIAKSFKGGLEFGYRPFLGPIDILGVQASYTIDLNKVDTEGHFLSGALIGLYAVKTDSSGAPVINEKGKPVCSLVSTVETKDETVQLDVGVGKYILKEITPPDGYVLSDTEYAFEITESNPVRKEKVFAGYTRKITNTKFTQSDYEKLTEKEQEQYVLVDYDSVALSGHAYWWTVPLTGIKTDHVSSVTVYVKESFSSGVELRCNYDWSTKIQTAVTDGKAEFTNITNGILSEIVFTAASKPDGIASIVISYGDGTKDTQIGGDSSKNVYYKKKTEGDGCEDSNGDGYIDTTERIANYTALEYFNEAAITVYEDQTFQQNEKSRTASAELTSLNTNRYQIEEYTYQFNLPSDEGSSATVTVPEDTVLSASCNGTAGTLTGNQITFPLNMQSGELSSHFTFTYTTADGTVTNEITLCYTEAGNASYGVVLWDGKIVDPVIDFSQYDEIGAFQIVNYEGLTIQKVDKAQNQPLSGAVLSLNERTGKADISFSGDSEDEDDIVIYSLGEESRTVKEWTSGNAGVLFSVGDDTAGDIQYCTLSARQNAEGIAVTFSHVYTLQEISAPSGYEISNPIYFFVMKENGISYLYTYTRISGDSDIQFPEVKEAENGDSAFMVTLSDLNGWQKVSMAEAENRVITMYDVRTSESTTTAASTTCMTTTVSTSESTFTTTVSTSTTTTPTTTSVTTHSATTTPTTVSTTMPTTTTTPATTSTTAIPTSTTTQSTTTTSTKAHTTTTTPMTTSTTTVPTSTTTQSTTATSTKAHTTTTIPTTKSTTTVSTSTTTQSTTATSTKAHTTTTIPTTTSTTTVPTSTTTKPITTTSTKAHTTTTIPTTTSMTTVSTSTTTKPITTTSTKAHVTTTTPDTTSTTTVPTSTTTQSTTTTSTKAHVTTTTPATTSTTTVPTSTTTQSTTTTSTKAHTTTTIPTTTSTTTVPTSTTTKSTTATSTKVHTTTTTPATTSTTTVPTSTTTKPITTTSTKVHTTTTTPATTSTTAIPTSTTTKPTTTSTSTKAHTTTTIPTTTSTTTVPTSTTTKPTTTSTSTKAHTTTTTPATTSTTTVPTSTTTKPTTTSTSTKAH
ncbi:MAG: collagen-binding domain-containing protein, partial [Ruminococcus sp.]